MEEIENAILEYVNEKVDYEDDYLDGEVDVSDLLDSVDYKGLIDHLESYLDVDISPEASVEMYDGNFESMVAKLVDILRD